jgi:hypothetical protein
VKQDDGTWKPTDAAIVNSVASADADGASVEFWATALDDKKDELFFLGSAIRPVKQNAPVVVAEAPKPAPAPVPQAQTKEAPIASSSPAIVEVPTPAPAYVAEDTAPKAASTARIASYPLIAAAAIITGIGIYFGALSASEKSQILSDQMAGMTSNSDLYNRDQSRIGQAQAANGLFITAGVLAVVAVILFIVGG